MTLHGWKEKIYIVFKILYGRAPLEQAKFKLFSDSLPFEFCRFLSVYVTSMQSKNQLLAHKEYSVYFDQIV